MFVHEVEIILNIDRPYPPLLRRPAYPASPKSREALVLHIKELLDLGVIRKVGHNEELKKNTPVIVGNQECLGALELRTLTLSQTGIPYSNISSSVHKHYEFP
ncbi:hypothetical protein O181_114357 [Austropuccinia psidii MF-1]|uniref:Uncharacterized protein n=1 Tax=Austropuccinia psidii MF-1 TaxID=1389203 RepID=A0A9Q3PWA1_9BASI|nr:hypothetical protein [Austropuccinia psidii MF-1]